MTRSAGTVRQVEQRLVAFRSFERAGVFEDDFDALASISTIPRDQQTHPMARVRQCKAELISTEGNRPPSAARQNPERL